MGSEEHSSVRRAFDLPAAFRGIVTRIEGLPIPSWGLAAWFLALISVRGALEQAFFGKPFELYLYYHHAFFFLVTLAAGTLLLSFWARADIVRTAKIVAAGYILLIGPPLLDRLAFHRVTGYLYGTPAGFLRKAATMFWNDPGTGKGILIMGAAIIVLAVVYTLLKTGSPWRAAGAALSLYAVAAVCGTPRLVLPLPRMGVPGVYESRHIMFFGAYFALLLALGTVGFALHRPKLMRAAALDVLSFRSAHFAVMTAAGIYFNSRIREHPFPGFILGLTAILLSSLGWVVTVLWNNAHDLGIDRISGRARALVRGWATPGEYRRLAGTLAVFVLFTSGVLGAKAFLIVGLALCGAYAYSAPPLRLRLRLGSNLIIGLGSFLTFYLGYFAWTTIRVWPHERVPVAVSFIIFAALTLGSVTKDAKDYEGDLEAGARTVFTVFGRERGGRIAAACLFLSLLTPLALFAGAVDRLVFSLVAAAAAFGFLRTRKLAVAFGAYAVAFAYAAARAAGLIGGSW
jgi:4-hydroxybenzoate polyprenyltransferase